MKKLKKFEPPSIFAVIIKLFVIGFLMTYPQSYITFIKSILGETLNPILLFLSLGFLGMVTLFVALVIAMIFYVVIKKKFS